MLTGFKDLVPNPKGHESHIFQQKCNVQQNP